MWTSQATVVDVCQERGTESATSVSPAARSRGRCRRRRRRGSRGRWGTARPATPACAARAATPVPVRSPAACPARPTPCCSGGSERRQWWRRRWSAAAVRVANGDGGGGGDGGDQQWRRQWWPQRQCGGSAGGGGVGWRWRRDEQVSILRGAAHSSTVAYHFSTHVLTVYILL
jgi:hypothetical protein